MKLKITVFILAVALVVISCNRASKSDAGTVPTQDMAIAEAPQTAVEQGRSEAMKEDLDYTSVTSDSISSGAADPVLNAGSPAPNIDWDKKIIKTADVTLEVKDFGAYDRLIHSSTKKFGAYIAGEQQNKSDFKNENVISFKVPVDRFEDMLNALPTEDGKIIARRISTEDVTDQLIDTKARIEVKKQVRDRYMELMKQAKAMKDVLEVQREITSLQEELEAAAGRVKYLGHQSAYSTINLTYYEYINGSSSTEGSFLTRLKEALRDGGSIIMGFILLLATFWPLLAGALLVWWLIRRSSLRTFSVGKK